MAIAGKVRGRTVVLFDKRGGDFYGKISATVCTSS
jgi:hypothetical protein